MKAVDQNVFDAKRGNCFAACIASILEIGIDEIPNFAEEEDIQKAANEWLKTRGKQLLSICFDSVDSLKKTYFNTNTYCLLCGRSPRKNEDGSYRYHATVGYANGYGVKTIHDPHPSREGLLEEWYKWVYFIIPYTGTNDGFYLV